jgi:mucin-associated surface protein (MASP), putative
MICQNQDNHLLYALKHGRFWFWDKHQNKWVPSDFAAQQYAKALTEEPDLAQEDWLGGCFGILMDDYEVPDAVVKALRALSNKEEPPCKVNTTAPNADAAVTTAAPAATLAEETSTTQADANSCPPDPCSPADASGAMSNPSGAAAACSATEFDYSGLDAQTVTDLHLAEQMYTSGRKLAEMGLRRMADGVSIAHEALVPNWDKRNNQYSEDTFRRWCESIGISKSAAYRLLQVTALFDNSSPEQQKILDSLSPSLLYAAAKPSAPADLVQAVKSGDITTHKQYQDLLKENQQLRADRVNALNAAAAAEAARDAALADVDGLHEQNRQLQAAATGAQESYRTAHKNEDSALRRATEAEQRAKEAEKQLAGARQVADAARMRADKYQREAEAAKAQPVAAAVDEDEINRRAHTLADELTAPLRSELEAAKAAAATPEQIELDTRNAYDSLLLAGRAMQNAWKSVKPQLAKLPPDTRAGAINQLTNTLTEIQTEAIKCL